METMEDLQSVIKLMERANETFAYAVWVPSLKKTVMFREINTSQQKRMIKAIIDSPVHNTEFIFALRDIIAENCIDTNIDVGSLTLVDKLFIALKMRSVSINDEVEVAFKAGEETVKRAFSIEKLIEDAQKVLKIEYEKTVKDKSGVYTIECGVPSIDIEYSLEKELHSNEELNEERTPENIRRIIGDVFTSELVKYIRSISIANADTITKIDMNSLSFRNRIALAEQIPSKILKEVIQYIADVKEGMKKVTLLKTTYQDKNGKDVEIEEALSVDGSFFIIS